MQPALMRLLLDTNVLLWVVASPARLDQPTQMLLQDRNNDVMFSAASIWEIAIKAGLGRADFAVDPQEVLAEATQAGFAELPIRASMAIMVATLPSHHRDPFDRLLVAQAMAEPACLVTADAVLKRYSDLVMLVTRSP